MGPFAMRSTTLAAILVCTALAACESGPFKKSEPRTAQQTPMQQQQLPPIKVEEATPRYKAELHTDLAAGYFERGQYDVALEELAESLKADPTYPKLYSVYGLVYAELGDEPKAELNFRKGLELAPADSEVRHNWGWYLCTHGRARDSIAEFEAALRNPLYRTPEIALINAGKCSVEAGDFAVGLTFLGLLFQVLPPGLVLLRIIIECPMPFFSYLPIQATHHENHVHRFHSCSQDVYVTQKGIQTWLWHTATQLLYHSISHMAVVY